MRRRKVDWEDEKRKTEKARMRGLHMTFIAFLMAAFWMLGMKQLHKDWPVGSALLVMGSLIAGTLILFYVIGKSKK
ncbi:MAG: hypothetical protein VB083_05540 [Aminobacterium sp.]|uniref:hypothetical protein n=1 Tax=Aminobacterium sp. TaxID=1872491 RepID=UPI002B216832|nr:hypothetical protein [Aminobacterium sp.]MEA4877348.1 hypothetical protein [Aminobacterium sp.]